MPPPHKGLEKKTVIRLRYAAKYPALLLVLCAPACPAAPIVSAAAAAAAASAQELAARQAVAQGGGRWTLAWQGHDAALIAALFAADGVEMGRGGVITRGRKAVGERFTRLFGAIGPVRASRQTVDLWQMGGTVTEAGRYAYVFAPFAAGRKPSVSAGNYVTVWQKQTDGQWLIHSDVTIAGR